MSIPKMSIPKMSIPIMSTMPKCLFPLCLLFQNVYSQNVYSLKRGGWTPPPPPPPPPRSLEGGRGRSSLGKFLKIYVSESAFQAINYWNHFFPYSLTSNLSKVRHSNPRGVLWNFHTCVGAGYFWGFKILNFDIFGGFQKNEYSFAYEDFVDILGGSSQATFRVHFHAL